MTSSHWPLDTAVLSHIGWVPATSLNWAAIAWLTRLGALAALTGLVESNRHDLAAA